MAENINEDNINESNELNVQKITEEEKQRMIAEILNPTPTYKMPIFKNSFHSEEYAIKKQKQDSLISGKIVKAILSCVLVLLCLCSGFLGGYISNLNVKQQIINEYYTSNNVNDVTIKTVSQDGTVTINGDISDTVMGAVKTVVLVQSTLSSGTSLGSGVMFSTASIAGDGYTYIVTNHHVIDGANSIKIQTYSGNIYNAILFGSSATYDLAILKVLSSSMNSADIAPATFYSDSSTLKLGQPTLAIGNALGEGYTVTQGILSSKRKLLNMDLCIYDLIQTDASINSGNSGGGLFDASGNLIGIVNAKSFGTGIEGLGYAIPSNSVKDVIVTMLQNVKNGYGYVPNGIFMGLVCQNSTNCIQVTGINYDTNSYICNGSEFTFAVGDLIGKVVAEDESWALEGNTMTCVSFAQKLKTLSVDSSITIIVQRTEYISVGMFGLQQTTKQYVVTATLKDYVYSN